MNLCIHPHSPYASSVFLVCMTLNVVVLIAVPLDCPVKQEPLPGYSL